MTAWLWLFGCFIALGVCVTAAEAINARRKGPSAHKGDIGARGGPLEP